MRRSSNYSNSSSNNSKKDSSKLSSKMESPKLQTRTTTSTFPPPHKTQLPMRYQTQLYQNPNSAKSSAAASSPFCRKNVLIIIFILLSFLFVSIYLISLARRLQSSHAVQLLSEKGYGIVIDAGSSGSRIHVFEYTRGHISAAVDLVGLESATLRKKPGLSSFADNPPLAGDSLKELLEFATQKVPKKEQSKTRVYLMATSGLRRLDENVREALLTSCRDVLQASKFLFHDKWVYVISGREKGIYAWVSANYALGTLHSDPLQTTGIIELGRASTQVTFVPEVPPPPSFKHTLELGGKTFVLYSYSFLNYGQEAAWDSLLESVLTGSATAMVTQETEEGVVIHPCTPQGYRWSVEEGQHHAVSISTGTHSPVSSILSQGNFSECRSAAYSLLQKDRDACTYPKCAIGSAFVPELRGNFFATGNCYYTSEFFKLPATTSLAEIVDAGQHYCGQDWTQIQEEHKGAEEKELIKYCFSTAYIVALLHDSLGIGMADERVKFTNKVHDVPLDWALGALIVRLNEDVEQSSPVWWMFTVLVLKGLFLVALLGIGILAIWFVARCRRPQLTTIYDLEKGRYITTASRGR
ncbi:unnamed protein product [Sphagnum jensenii]|uniref:Apyrase n=1 Tax=Sphagnum jensenii TaxID=128206 RepID=A0ABP1AKI5_9BRYO